MRPVFSDKVRGNVEYRTVIIEPEPFEYEDALADPEWLESFNSAVVAHYRAEGYTVLDFVDREAVDGQFVFGVLVAAQ